MFAWGGAYVGREGVGLGLSSCAPLSSTCVCVVLLARCRMWTLWRRPSRSFCARLKALWTTWTRCAPLRMRRCPLCILLTDSPPLELSSSSAVNSLFSMLPLIEPAQFRCSSVCAVHFWEGNGGPQSYPATTRPGHICPALACRILREDA